MGMGGSWSGGRTAHLKRIAPHIGRPFPVCGVGHPQRHASSSSGSWPATARPTAPGCSLTPLAGRRRPRPNPACALPPSNLDRRL